MDFSAQQRDGPLPALAAALKAVGAEVWDRSPAATRSTRRPPAGPIGSAWPTTATCAMPDGLFAVVNGCPPDEGVMVELGMAIAWEKPVFLFRDDFRRCTDSEDYPLNLMVFVGLPETGWRAHWYGSIEEIADPGKALARWLKDTD